MSRPTAVRGPHIPAFFGLAYFDAVVALRRVLREGFAA